MADAGGAPSRRARQRGPTWVDRLVPVGAALVTLVLRLLRATLRVRTIREEVVYGAWRRREQMILAFWHEQLVMMPLLYAGPRACIMVSRHRDGELIARAVAPLGVITVRGSSTRGWAGALKGLLEAYRTGADLAFATDGPKGPRRVVKSGVIQMARATGAPIVPIAAAPRWHARLGSWDRLVIPVPGTRVAYVAGTPLVVPSDADATRMEEARAALEAELLRITAEAEAAS